MLAAMGVLSLAFAVFGWGIQYKLSLYNLPGSAPTSMPVAKLLSQKERPVYSTNVQVVRPPSPQPLTTTLFPVLFFAAIVLSSRLRTYVRMQSVPRWDLRRQNHRQDSASTNGAASFVLRHDPPSPRLIAIFPSGGPSNRLIAPTSLNAGYILSQISVTLISPFP